MQCCAGAGLGLPSGVMEAVATVSVVYLDWGFPSSTPLSQNRGRVCR